MWNETEVLICYHCGNRVPQMCVGHNRGKELFEQMDGHRFNEDFDYFFYQCPTCDGISIYGDFSRYSSKDSMEKCRIYPVGDRLLPQVHRIASVNCLPEAVYKGYQEIWPLKQISPGAFVAQIRRVLEVICRDKNAKGKTLFEMLQDLEIRGILPGHFSTMSALIRRIGNLGTHVDDYAIDVWDAELIDDFFLLIIDYVYVVPSRIERINQRLSAQLGQN